MRARRGASACALYVGGNLNLKNATNMETTEQRFTQIRAEREKRNKSQGEKSTSNSIVVKGGQERAEQFSSRNTSRHRKKDVAGRYNLKERVVNESGAYLGEGRRNVVGIMVSTSR